MVEISTGIKIINELFKSSVFDKKRLFRIVPHVDPRGGFCSLYSVYILSALLCTYAKLVYLCKPT